nr:MAG TPA: C2H2 type zinc-finger protein [Caudoviricetes sp.]
MTIVKCDWCGKSFISGYAMLIRPVSHSRFPEANVAANQNSPLLKGQYDVCVECMHRLLEAKADEECTGV